MFSNKKKLDWLKLSVKELIIKIIITYLTNLF